MAVKDRLPRRREERGPPVGPVLLGYRVEKKVVVGERLKAAQEHRAQQQSGC